MSCILDRLLGQDRVEVLVVPRTERQRRIFERRARGRRALRVGRDAIDSPSLIFASDLVVSGSGTMTREAAVLGVPAVSCFEGLLGAVDRRLAGEGKLAIVRRWEDMDRLGDVKRAPRAARAERESPLESIVHGICSAGGA